MTICKFEGWRSRYFAFKSMVEFVPSFINTSGLRFCKLLGCGNKNGFGIFPNFGQYVLICTWETHNDALLAFQSSPAFCTYTGQSSSFQTLYMKTQSSHGLWGNKAPFIISEDENPNPMVAVLTRATIKWKDMIRFWQHVPKVSNSIYDAQSPIFAVGIGEMPFRYQATFSIWEDIESMKAYAYKNKHHMEMIQKTRKIGWYSEELFARFKPYSYEGNDIIGISKLL